MPASSCGTSKTYRPQGLRRRQWSRRHDAMTIFAPRWATNFPSTSTTRSSVSALCQNAACLVGMETCERATVQVAVREEMGVSSIVVLEDIELIPVVELEPYVFATKDRSFPSGRFEDIPEEWYRYWLESLANSGIAGLMPVQSGYWHVPTREFTDTALLRRVLELIFQNLSEKGFSCDRARLHAAARWRSRLSLPVPECADRAGLLRRPRRSLITGETELVTDGPSGDPLSMGHPCLSVRYHAPTIDHQRVHTKVSPPTARWAVCPDQLQAAVAEAGVELERFARADRRRLAFRL